jgi:hypothetical protein
MCGKPFQAMINGAFWVVGLIGAIFGFPIILICMVHAVGVVHNFYADQRAQRVAR